MSPSLSLFERVKANLFENYSKDAGKMLLHTGTLAWTTSAIAQIFGIINNDKISKDQKKFLVPQEIADAAINILSFYMVTDTIQNFTKKMASKGKIISPAIKKFCEDHGIKIGEKTTDIGKSILSSVDEYKAAIKVNETENIAMIGSKKEELTQKIQKLNEFYDKTYSPFENGLKIVGNIVGAVLSSNIITPLFRNPIASMKQKMTIEQDKTELTPVDRPIYLAQNNYLTKGAYSNNAGMKI